MTRRKLARYGLIIAEIFELKYRKSAKARECGPLRSLVTMRLPSSLNGLRIVKIKHENGKTSERQKKHYVEEKKALEE